MKMTLYAFLFLLSNAQASTLVSAQDGSWNDSSTWGGFIPSSVDTAIIRDGYDVVITGETAIASTVRIGPTSSGGSLNISGGSLSATSLIEMDVFNSEANGSIVQSGGTVETPDLLLSAPVRQSNTNGTAAYTISGGSLSVSNDFIIGGNSEGIFTVVGTNALISGNGTADLSLDRGPVAGAQHAVFFETGVGGVSVFDGFSTLNISSDSYFVVNGYAYAGDTQTVHLIDADSVSGVTSNFTVFGTPGSLRMEDNGLYLDLRGANRFSGLGLWHGLQSQMDNINNSETPSEIIAANTNVTMARFIWKWRWVEDENDVYDWTQFDAEIAECINAGITDIQLTMWVVCPDWIYDSGVPEIEGTSGNPLGTFPYYLDPDFLPHYFDFLDEYLDHVAAMPQSTRDKISSICSCEGITGDELPWYGQPTNTAYQIDPDSAEWLSYRRSVWEYLYNGMAVRGLGAKLYLNPGNDGINDTYVNTYLSEAKLKAGALGHGYAYSNEKFHLDRFQERLADPDDHLSLFCEFDHDKMGWYQEAPVWNAYWCCLWFLHAGVSPSSWRGPQLVNTNLMEGFDFYAKYADGISDPEHTPGVWIAFHDGLDVADTNFYPESTYGTFVSGYGSVGLSDRVARATNILNACAGRGAVKGDDESLSLNMQIWEDTELSGSRTADALCDIQYNVHRGDYSMYITNKYPYANTVGFWRIGSTNEPYGRYARGFDYSGGRNKFLLDIDDATWGGGALDARFPVELRLVYYDEGDDGVFEIRYDSTSGGKSLAFVTNNAAIPQWKEVSYSLTDARFGNNLAGTCDIRIENEGTTNCKFHMLEVIYDR